MKPNKVMCRKRKIILRTGNSKWDEQEMKAKEEEAKRLMKVA